jgi:hypothetical protein
MARAMPVLPEDGSMMRLPGVRVPSASASVLALELGQQPDVRVRAEVGDVDHRRVADEIDDRTEHGHVRKPPSSNDE